MRVLIQGVLALLLANLPPEHAGAVLGESASSVPRHATLWRSQRQLSLNNPNFQVKEVDDSGVMVREYIGPDSKVFAVTWRGLRQPDLETLLGGYHGELRAAEKQRPPKRAFREPSELKGINITVERGGHMRDIRGRAYLTDHLPSGVRPEDLE
jgi:hypothetical protein